MISASRGCHTQRIVGEQKKRHRVGAILSCFCCLGRQTHGCQCQNDDHFTLLFRPFIIFFYFVQIITGNCSQRNAMRCIAYGTHDSIGKQKAYEQKRQNYNRRTSRWWWFERCDVKWYMEHSTSHIVSWQTCTPKWGSKNFTLWWAENSIHKLLLNVMRSLVMCCDFLNSWAFCCTNESDVRMLPTFRNSSRPGRINVSMKTNL